MVSSVLVLMSLLSNHNVKTNMFDIEYLKTQEKNRLQQFKKERGAHNTGQKREYKALMFSSKTQNMYNLNNFKYYLNYNIMKEHKR